MPTTTMRLMTTILALVALAASPGCRGSQKDRKGPSGAAGARGASGTDAAPATARFLGFGQSSDAKQRTVRYEIVYHAARAARAVRLRLRYHGAADQALGEFPLDVARPVSAPITQGQRLIETFDLMGHEGPPEKVTGIRIHVEQVTFVDDSTWIAPTAGKQ